MKHSRKFIFDTPINVPEYLSKKHQTLCYARVEGIGYYHDQSHSDSEREDDPESLFDFDIDTVILKEGLREQDSTIAYRCSKALTDTFADVIEKATMAHMGYLFDDLIASHWNREPVTAINEPDATDMGQDSKVYQVIAVVGTAKQLTDYPFPNSKTYPAA